MTPEDITKAEIINGLLNHLPEGYRHNGVGEIVYSLSEEDHLRIELTGNWHIILKASEGEE